MREKKKLKSSAWFILPMWKKKYLFNKFKNKNNKNIIVKLIIC